MLKRTPIRIAQPHFALQHRSYQLGDRSIFLGRLPPHPQRRSITQRNRDFLGHELSVRRNQYKDALPAPSPYPSTRSTAFPATSVSRKCRPWNL